MPSDHPDVALTDGVLDAYERLARDDTAFDAVSRGAVCLLVPEVRRLRAELALRALEIERAKQIVGESECAGSAPGRHVWWCPKCRALRVLSGKSEVAAP